MFSSQKKLRSIPPPANGLAPQSTQQPQPICTWSAHAPRSGLSPPPLPRYCHSLTATAGGELLLFGGYVHGCANSDFYVLSTRDFSSTLLQTSGEIPTPRAAHVAVLIGTTLLVFGGALKSDNQNVPSQHPYDSLYILNLGTSDLIMPSPTPADHSFARQYRESGLALRSMDLGSLVVTPIPQPWSVPSSSSSVDRSMG